MLLRTSFGLPSIASKVLATSALPSLSNLTNLCVGENAEFRNRGMATGFSIMEEELGLTKIDGHFGHGFQLNGIRVFGSVVCLRDFWLQWKPRTVEEITPESLSFLKLFKPIPEILVLGCGDTMEPVPPGIQKYLDEEEIAVESLDTGNAIPLFNLLNLEGRSVMGAFLPVGITAEEQIPIPQPFVKDM
ncbi:hypothetical protein BSKO_02373 [Bryopsis sp. KO-2023]|nr:hypothetical protein BSKO_02373 [Bryopsis sp. KO-2023]